MAKILAHFSLGGNTHCFVLCFVPFKCLCSVLYMTVQKVLYPDSHL